jgi:hypothetical protein
MTRLAVADPTLSKIMNMYPRDGSRSAATQSWPTHRIYLRYLARYALSEPTGLETGRWVRTI